MMHLPSTDAEVIYRHHQVHRHYVESQRMLSFKGIRQIIGNTLIALGSSVHGMAQGACRDAAETRRVVRDIARSESVTAEHGPQQAHS